MKKTDYFRHCEKIKAKKYMTFRSFTHKLGHDYYLMTSLEAKASNSAQILAIIVAKHSSES